MAISYVRKEKNKRTNSSSFFSAFIAREEV
jgi:hypothetical protein